MNFNKIYESTSEKNVLENKDYEEYNNFLKKFEMIRKEKLKINYDSKIKKIIALKKLEESPILKKTVEYLNSQSNFLFQFGLDKDKKKIMSLLFQKNEESKKKKK